MTPPLREFHHKGMHRLIPSRYSESGTVLEEVAPNEAMLADAARLDAATNERIHGEHNGLSGISPFELVYGIPNAHIVRAAFLHPGPFGSRFNDTTRGAWYAAKKVETSIAEVAYHKSKRLSEMVVPGLPHERPNEEVSTYDRLAGRLSGPVSHSGARGRIRGLPSARTGAAMLPAVAAAGATASRPTVQRNPLSQRAPQGRHMPGLLSSCPCLSAAPGRDV